MSGDAMRRLSREEFEAQRDAFDRCVAVTPEISRFGSASAWNMAARDHLKDVERPPDDRTFIWRDGEGPDDAIWLLFGRSAWDYWQPFESAWMFSCPLIGRDPGRAVECLREAAGTLQGGTEPSGFIIGGVREGGMLQRALRRVGEAAAKGYREFPATNGVSIDLSRGVEAWLGRRSRKFRRSLQAAERRCREAGLSLECCDGATDPGLLDRLLSIQVRTAKWETGTDIFQDDRYLEFYRSLFSDLQKRGALRLLIARRDGEDVAFIFGGVFAGEYRGLQMSYAGEVAGCGAGNWLQWENLRLREREGVVQYDLGMEAPYKLRWADDRHELRFSFIVL
ncbi:MAG: GNAT family N-acetyltransferase [Verrucomicrobiae bacterium]|nr:GNAT family N-acetyltransferase [Verrucomicrobiae bacterium]